MCGFLNQKFSVLFYVLCVVGWMWGGGGGGKMGLYWSLPESEVCGPLLCVCVLLVGCWVGVGANKVGMYW